MATAAQEHIFMELLFTDWKDERDFLMQLNVCSITVRVNFYHVLIFLMIMLKRSVEKMKTTSMSLERPALPFRSTDFQTTSKQGSLYCRQCATNITSK